ncbi:Hypothetical protein A7982_11961 [Minicystis rosea]|nr:Hypothetical protein A7982_11961 [Minicystis rosea]
MEDRMPIQPKRKPKAQSNAQGTALAAYRDRKPEERVLYATFEVGVLVAAADGKIDDTELDMLGQNFANWLHLDVSAAFLDKMVKWIREMLAKQSRAARLADCASLLDAEQRRTAFDFAAAIGVMSGGESAEETRALRDVALAFDIPEKEAQKRWQAIRATFEDGDETNTHSGNLVITRPDGSERTVQGYLFEDEAKNVRIFKPSPETKPQARVDLRPFLTPVEDQGRVGSCSANAVAGAYEYLVKRHLPEDQTYDVSRLFLYYEGRAAAGGPIVDKGSHISLLIQTLQTKGAPSEETWPYDVAKVNTKPSSEAYAEAAEFLVQDVARVPLDLDVWRATLTEGHPIIFGTKLFKSFDTQRKPGLIPMPSAEEASRGEHGAHAMLAVGYSDRDRVMIVRNSWGAKWGDNGYCYIPYDYLFRADYSPFSAWLIRQVDAFDHEEGWGDDGESLLPDLENELAGMSDEDHRAMLDAMGKVPLETRLAHILLAVAGADGEVSDEELGTLSKHLEKVMKQLGSDLDPEKVLRFAKKHEDDQKLFDTSVARLGEHLSNSMLAAIVNIAREIAESDDASDEENELLAYLVETWQLESEGEESEEEESEDEEPEDEDEESEESEEEESEDEESDEEESEDEDEESEDEDEESEDEDEESEDDEEEESEDEESEDEGDEGEDEGSEDEESEDEE